MYKTSCFRRVSTNIIIGDNKTSLNLVILYFYFRGELSIYNAIKTINLRYFVCNYFLIEFGIFKNSICDKISSLFFYQKFFMFMPNNIVCMVMFLNLLYCLPSKSLEYLVLSSKKYLFNIYIQNYELWPRH